MNACTGTLSEPEPNRFACSLGAGCAAVELIGSHGTAGDETDAQQVRDAHQHRVPPHWLTETGE